MENYEYIKSIGQGMYGQVFLARNKIENKNYAIKRINFQDIAEKDKNNIENEVKLLKQLRHPNIVSYKDSFLDKDNYYNIVMIYCDGGDIYSKIKAQKKEYFPEEDILNWIVQLCLALSYIHDKKILHRDLKTQNIFIQNKDTIRIGDFGIAKIFNQTREMAGSIVGTPLYMSPEQYNGKNYGYKSDIWSLGCCVYEMCNLKHAFEGNTWNAVVVKVLKGQHNPVNNIYSRDLINLVEAMLNINSKSRPTVARILESKLIKPKVANYIMDFVGNYKKYDGDLEQVEILKEQAEKFGIFQTNINNVINLSSNAINSGGNGIDNGYESKVKNKDNQDMKGINDYEKKSLLEQKKKIEGIISDLEKQRKSLLEEIRKKGEMRRNILSNNSKSVKKNNNSNNIINNGQSNEKYSSLEKKIPYNKNKNKFYNNNNIDEYNELKSNNNNNIHRKFVQNSQSPKHNLRKSSGNEENNNNNKFNNRPLTSNKKKNNINNNINSKNDFNSSGYNNNNIYNYEIGNISIIKEEQNSYVAERNKVTKITQELGKMKKMLEKTNDKINEVFNNGGIVIQEDQYEDKNIINGADNKAYNNENNNFNENEINNNNINNNNNVINNKEKIINERINFFKTRCVNSLGQKLYNKAYDYLKSVRLNNNMDPIIVREHLTNIFGKNNIGFWQLIEQILILEDLR